MKYLTIKELSEMWNVSERMIRYYCSTGKIDGCIRSGKSWLIPENSKKPTKENQNIDESYIKIGEEFIEFVRKSPVSFHTIDTIKKMLIEDGYLFLSENSIEKLQKGSKYVIVRDDSTLVSINIGNNIEKEISSLNIIASHCDSPYFKIKPNCDGVSDGYNKINIAPYGGLIAPSWLDRPLAVAGRVIIRENDKLIAKLVNFEDLNAIIPNLCIHYNRNINSGYEYNMAVDMQAFFSDKDSSKFSDLLAKKLKTRKENIVNHDLYLYNNEKGILWGNNKEYVSCPRLDDLECVFSSAKAFISGENDKTINILYISDNEEVGSLSKNGADSDFLEVCLRRLCNDLGLDLDKTLSQSFLISADNGHAVHPNKGQITDADNKMYMNKGVGIKSNSSLTYTSSGLSSSVFQMLCEKANTPYQFFTNRSDMRGGSTLGNILLSHLSLSAVDVGLPQLAMHSCYETAGTKDLKYAIDVFREFYTSRIKFNLNEVIIEK